jgi:hypothetical protein
VKRLYVLTVEYTAYVMAESEAEAEGLEDEVTRTETFPEIRADLVHHHNGIEGGWDGDCLVYGTDTDTKLSDVWPEHPGAGPGRQEHPDQVEMPLSAT